MFAAFLMAATMQVMAANGRVTFSATGTQSHWGELTAKTADGTALTSGTEVADGTQVTFTAPQVVGYYVDWYVNDVNNEEATDFTFVLSVTADVKVEARYTEAFKLIFENTPFVKYADRNGYVYYGANFYHYTGPKNGAYGTSVSSWKEKDGTKTHNVDNVPNDTTIVRDTLTADKVLTPVYLDNGDDLGDASATAVWSFAYPDSVPLFRQFKDVCHYVQPTLFNAAYTDVCMVCDAREGLIDNELRMGKGNTIVNAGTRFRLPVLYGTIFKIAGTNEFTATTIDGETPETGKEGDYFTASLTVSNPSKDSIDIVIGENQCLKYISASYPGGNTTLTWTTNIKTAESAIGTASKTGEGGSVIYGMTDIANIGGLTVTPLVRDTLTSEIQATLEKAPDKYITVSFDVAKDYSFNIGTVSVPIAPIGAGKECKVELYIEDERGNKLDSIFSNITTDSLTTFAMTGPKSTATNNNSIYLYGHVTLKIFVYGADAKYCFGSPITIQGVTCETITCGEGRTWGVYVTKGSLDMEKLVGLHVYQVVSVNEKQLTITKVPLEEGRQASIVLINTEQPGAIFNTPLTRADDAYSVDNILHVSDGTVVGDRTRYRFTFADDMYYFKMIPEGEVIPEGEIYLEWDSFTYPEILYNDATDAANDIDDLDMNSQLATGKTRRVLKNGQIFIVRPDGTVYNLSGVRVY